MEKKKHLNFYKKIKNNFYGIYKANNNKFFYGCGSYLMGGKIYRYDKALFNKQLLLYNIVKKHNTILEIGVYMAHSMLIMLTSNPKLNIYGIDIDKKYSLPSINYLQKKFPKSKLKFLEGDSIEILKKLKKRFDLFHIDGDHQPAKIYKEIIACSKLTKNKNMKILFDDVDMMKSVEKSIVKSFKVKKYIKPISKYRNLYLEIVLDKKSFRKFMILFYFFHLLEVPKIYLIPILKTMIRKVIIIIFGKKFCNYFGKLILNNFSNIYFIIFAKKLINIYKENRY
jgi:hypothetical protein